MAAVVILGSTGMIGSGLAKFFSTMPYSVIEANRKGVPTYIGNKVIKFDVKENPVAELFEHIPSESLLINLIGVIRHKIQENDLNSSANAIRINGEFPLELITEVEANNCKLIQIATDCVFSGESGNYSEYSIKDPIDLYGKSKVQGETNSQSLMTLRVSVIGRELSEHIELMDWVLESNKFATISGYSNHLWNGITTLQLGRMIRGILDSGNFRAGTFHVVPEGKVSKFELVSSVAKKGARSDLNIKKTAAVTPIDRTLITQFPEFNSILWGEAGYDEIPTIDFMLSEYFNWEKNRI